MSVDQAKFTTALLNPDIAVPKGLIDPLGRSAGKRFDVYRNNVVASLIDAMETAFPVVQKLIGAENFRKLSSLYVRKHPPDSPLLMFYGAAFPSFLETFEPLAHVPYLADVARLELARRTAYHAADCVPIETETLGRIAPDRLMDIKLTLAPAMQIIQSPYPIVAIWNFNMVPGAEKPTAEAQTALITRPELDLKMQSIDMAQSAFLYALRDNKTLEQAFTAGSYTIADFDLSAAIVMILQMKTIIEISG